MKIQQNATQTRITGDHSIQSVTIDTEILTENFSTPEDCFHTLKRWRRQNMLASMGTMGTENWKYTQDNIARNERYWQWVEIQKGHELFWGYAHVNGNRYEFCNDTVDLTA